MKFLSIIFFMFFISHIQGNKVAVTTKVKGFVEIMPVGQENFSNLKPGTILADGDRIRTGSSGFTAVIFIDDKSTLKLKENSEAVINGQRSARSIAKKINMDVGTIRATVNKQNSNFVIQTPTSVASVKGTDFWMITNPVDGDLVIGLEGVVSLINNETGSEVDIIEGTSGTSTPDGNVDVEETEESSIPDDPTDQDEQQSQIKIYFEGPNGEQKVLIIDYQ
tara:strand:- start:986 stop:1651 length:666 start_codon:yes stop_codon:yes gene_type:complete